VFNRERMSKYLSKETLNIVLEAIDRGTTLHRGIAEHVAAGMKMWAIEMGATHYTHWFQPLTGALPRSTTRLSITRWSGENIIERFSGKLLAQTGARCVELP